MLKSKIIILCAAACLMSNASIVSCNTGMYVESLQTLTVKQLSDVLRSAFAQNLLKIDFSKVFDNIYEVKIDDHTTMTKKELCEIAQQINSRIDEYQFDLDHAERAECITQAVVMIAKLRAIDGAIKEVEDHYELYVDDVSCLSPADMSDKELLNSVFNQADEGLEKLIGLITSGKRKLSPIFRNRLRQLKSGGVQIGASIEMDVWGGMEGGLVFPKIDENFINSDQHWALSEYIEYSLSHELGHFVHNSHAGISSVVSANQNCLLLAVKSLSNAKESICNDKLFDLNTFGKMWQGGDDVLNILGAIVGFYAKKGSTDVKPDVKPIIIYDSNCENAWRFFHSKPLRLTHNSTCITPDGLKREQYESSEAIPPKNELVDDKLCDSDTSLESLDCADSIFTELNARYTQMTGGLKSGDDVAH